MRRIKRIALFVLLSMLLVVACKKTDEKTDKGTEKKTDDLKDQISTGGAEDKVPDPNAPKMSVISVYIPNPDGVGLKQKMDALYGESVNIDGIWSKLKEYELIPDDSEVLSFDINDGKGVLDASALNTQNKYIIALGNTLVENFELKSIDIKLNGKAISSNFEYNTNYKKVE